ncbi:MAG TPA: hypothetical protein VJ246_01235 [Patescibacteria group bacterium]|nr:hypothetical protein [Patescibacteria group bacterium]
MLKKRLTLSERTFATDYLLHFSIAAVVMVMATRAYLHLFNYPQLGTGGLHIAHVLWGGLFLTAAVLIALLVSGRAAGYLTALLGGMGFGLFIDEIGKFITKDNNYFYQPTAVIVYLAFLGLFFLLRRVHAKDHTTLVELTQQSYLMRLQRDIRNRYMLASSKHRFQSALQLILWGYAFVILVQFVVMIWGFLLSRGGGWAALLRAEDVVENTRVVWSSVFLLMSNVIAAACITVGAIRSRRSRSVAYLWYERATIVWIFFTQVFMFYRDQFSATFILAGSVLLFGAVRSARTLEDI